jgi:adenylosuccinate synthase
MPISIIRGNEWGDEGKGKIVDFLVNTDQYFTAENKVVANIRPSGGSNAGHTIVDDGGNVFAFHMLPSTVINPGILSVIGNHAYVDPVGLHNEIRTNRKNGLDISKNSLAVSYLAPLTLPHYVILDQLNETGDGKKGSTQKGISQTAAAFMLHEDVRLGEAVNMREQDLKEIAVQGLSNLNKKIKLGVMGPGSKKWEFSDDGLSYACGSWAKSVKRLRPFVADPISIVHELLGQGKNILLEGAQGHGLDVTYGKRPYVSSSLNTAAGMLHAVGVGDFRSVDGIIGVSKLVKSKVGGGHFVTEETNAAIAARLRGNPEDVDGEYGTTTGRPREVGAIDVVQLRNAIRIGGGTELVINKFDKAHEFGDVMKICIAYRIGRKTVEYAPITNSELTRARPEYIEVPTWGDISKIREYDKLPQAAKDCHVLLEDLLGVQISMLGVGPQRDQTILTRS